MKCSTDKDCPYKTTMPVNPRNTGNCNYDKTCRYQKAAIEAARKEIEK